jgi:hypothetical protein
MKKAFILSLGEVQLPDSDVWTEWFTNWLTNRIKQYSPNVRFSIFSLDSVEDKQLYVLYLEMDGLVDPEYWSGSFQGWLKRKFSTLSSRGITCSVYDVHQLGDAHETESSFDRHPSNWRGGV